MAKTQSINIEPVKIEIVPIVLVGDTTHIQNRFSRKALLEIEKKQQKRATSKKEERDPHKEFLSSMYRHPDGGYAIPGRSFKAAIVDAAADSGIYKTTTRRAIFIPDEWVRIYHQEKPRMRTDRVVIGQGTTSVAYRGEFKDWWVVINVEYDSGLLSLEQVVNLVNRAGFSCGVGEWRPNAPKTTGNHGRFHVADKDEAEHYFKLIENGDYVQEAESLPDGEEYEYDN